MMIRDRNVLNINWVVYLANLLAMRGHEVIIGCDTYSKLGKTGTGYDLDPRVKICNLRGLGKNVINFVLFEKTIFANNRH